MMMVSLLLVLLYTGWLLLLAIVTRFASIVARFVCDNRWSYHISVKMVWIDVNGWIVEYNNIHVDTHTDHVHKQSCLVDTVSNSMFAV